MYRYSQHQLSRQYRSSGNVVSSDIADFPSVFLDGHYLVWSDEHSSCYLKKDTTKKMNY